MLNNTDITIIIKKNHEFDNISIVHDVNQIFLSELNESTNASYKEDMFQSKWSNVSKDKKEIYHHVQIIWCQHIFIKE